MRDVAWPGGLAVLRIPAASVRWPDGMIVQVSCALTVKDEGSQMLTVRHWKQGWHWSSG